MKARVCQLFEVCQHEFANFSLPCEGRLTSSNSPTHGPREFCVMNCTEINMAVSKW